MRAVLLAIACFTLQDLQNARCDSLCVRDGYSRGSAIKGECACIDMKGTPNAFARRAVNMGPMPAEQAASFRPDNKSGNINVYPPSSTWSHADD